MSTIVLRGVFQNMPWFRYVTVRKVILCLSAGKQDEAVLVMVILTLTKIIRGKEAKNFVSVKMTGTKSIS